MLNIPILIFDWSGVISDDRRPVYESNMRLLEHYGKPKMTFREWLPRTTLSAREFLANEGVVAEPEEIFEEYKKMLNKVVAEGIHPVIYLDTKQSLQKLLKAGKKLIVISSHPEKNLREEAKKYGIEEYFTFFTGSVKNKTQTIIKICQKITMSLSPENVAYIGDTIYDIQAAKKAGVYSVAITGGYHTKDRLLKENPDQVIESLAELF